MRVCVSSAAPTAMHKTTHRHITLDLLQELAAVAAELELAQPLHTLQHVQVLEHALGGATRLLLLGGSSAMRGTLATDAQSPQHTGERTAATNAGLGNRPRRACGGGCYLQVVCLVDRLVALEHALHDHKVQLTAQVVHLQAVHAIEPRDERVRVLHHILCARNRGVRRRQGIAEAPRTIRPRHNVRGSSGA